jgi:hypothetical protein
MRWANQGFAGFKERSKMSSREISQFATSHLTDDLFHAITTNAGNLLILGASVAAKSILEHPKTGLSTFASTFKNQKEEVWSISPREQSRSRAQTLCFS